MGSGKMAPIKNSNCLWKITPTESLCVCSHVVMAERTDFGLCEIFDHLSCLVILLADVNVLEELHQYYVQLPFLQFCLALLPVRMLAVIH